MGQTMVTIYWETLAFYTNIVIRSFKALMSTKLQIPYNFENNKKFKDFIILTFKNPIVYNFKRYLLQSINEETTFFKAHLTHSI